MFRTPIGTHDSLPAESARRHALETKFREFAERYGFGHLETPIFEASGVFERLGEGTDVVRKEMYRFTDQGDREMALRPEGTAAVCRAFVQHNPLVPWKVTYGGPFFRYEAPQAGRFRQFHQLGAETLGTDDPDADVEIITLAHYFLKALGLEDIQLVINSMGDSETIARYVAELGAFLESVQSKLDVEDQPKVATHPLRVLDSKRPATVEVVSDAPRITADLSDEAEAHYERVQSGLSQLGIGFVEDWRLVRGLDYYTHTTFEFKSMALISAQDTVCGGGRYNGLVAALGGKSIGGVGFALGVERLLLACDAEAAFGVDAPVPQVWVADVTATGEEAGKLTAQLRAKEIRANRAFGRRSMRAQLKAADRSGAQLAVIVGDDELAEQSVTLRTLRENDDLELTPDVTRQWSVHRSEWLVHVCRQLGLEDRTETPSGTPVSSRD